jgi:hypothetical protein
VRALEEERRVAVAQHIWAQQTGCTQRLRLKNRLCT